MRGAATASDRIDKRRRFGRPAVVVLCVAMVGCASRPRVATQPSACGHPRARQADAHLVDAEIAELEAILRLEPRSSADAIRLAALHLERADAHWDAAARIDSRAATVRMARLPNETPSVESDAAEPDPPDPQREAGLPWPTHSPPRPDIDALPTHARTEVLAADADVATAVRLLTALVPTSSRDDRLAALELLAAAYESRGDDQNARRTFVATIQVDPTGPRAGRGFRSFGDHFLRSAQFREAYGMYERALTELPEDERDVVRFRLAWVDFQLGRPNDALALLERASPGAAAHDPPLHAAIDRLTPVLYAAAHVPVVATDAVAYSGRWARNAATAGGFFDALAARLIALQRAPEAIDLLVALASESPDQRCMRLTRAATVASNDASRTAIVRDAIRSSGCRP